MKENKNSPDKEVDKSDVLIPFHFEGEIVKAVADLKGHKFIQQGPYLKCQSCMLHHAVFIGPKLIMVGYREDGSPKLVKRA